MKSYLDIFSGSPFKPLQRHMDTVYAVLTHLEKLILAAVAGDGETTADCNKTIQRLEGEADIIKREVFSALPRNIFTPVPRSDLINLVITQDQIANRAEDLAGRVTIWQGTPYLDRYFSNETMLESLKQYISCTMKEGKLAHKAVNEFDELLATGFSGKEASRVHMMMDDMERAGDEARRALLSLIEQVWEHSKRKKALDAIYVLRVIDHLSELNRQLRAFADQFELILAQS